MEMRLRRFWEAHHLLPQRPVLVGVSGGADSLALMSAMHAAGLRLVAAHYDHGLRPESGAEAGLVAQVCQRLGVPLARGRGDVAAYARSQRLSLEDAARRLRYAFLFAQAEEHGAQAVAVAHTADDQAETVLMHLLGGSGLEGLRGMRAYALPNPWSRRIPLVRPLLESSRAEVEAWCRAQGLVPVQDASNRERRFLRNRLRLDVLPVLEACNPQVRAALLRSARLLGDADAALGQWAAQVERTCVPRRAERWVQVNPQALEALPAAVQRRILRQALRSLEGDLREIGFEGVERIRRLGHGQAHLPGGLRAVRESDGLWLLAAGAHAPRDAWPQADEAALGEVHPPAEVTLLYGWRLSVRPQRDLPAALTAARRNRDPFRAWLALPTGAAALQIRLPQAGVRIHPLGMGGRSVKLSDLFINARIPRRARARWPLVYVQGRLAWAPGLRVDEAFRLHSGSGRVLVLHCRRGNALGETA